jgi:hypothetical protein
MDGGGGIVMQWAFKSIAPRVRWRIATKQPRQQIFVVVLKADGVEDFELPVSSINLRLRDVRGSYVRVIVPNPVDYTDDILARTSGRMVIYSGYKTADGVRHLEELIYANIQNLYFNQGGNSGQLTLAGTRYMTNSNPKTVELEGASRIAKSEDGKLSVDAPLDFFIRPGDTASAYGETFTIDLINCMLSASDARMEVQGG